MYHLMSQCYSMVTSSFVVFIAVSGEGVTLVCVSRVSTDAPGGAEEDPQLSQQQQQSVK